MQVTWGQFQQASFESAGLSAAWRLSTNLYSLSAVQRPGRSFLDRDGFNFYKIREGKGLKAAIKERDKLYEPYFPTPRPTTG